MGRMRVLGIDPGSVITGWGVVEAEANRLYHVDNGGIFTRSKDFHQRLREIHDGLLDVIRTYEPTHASMEQVFMAKNAQSALKLGHARGVALIVALNANLPIAEYTPMQIKRAVTGTGRAPKEQVARMVQTLLGLPEPAQVDASDALAAAICHLLAPTNDLIGEAAGEDAPHLPPSPKRLRRRRSKR